jgi:hypothetical protein
MLFRQASESSTQPPLRLLHGLRARNSGDATPQRDSLWTLQRPQASLLRKRIDHLSNGSGQITC